MRLTRLHRLAHHAANFIAHYVGAGRVAPRPAARTCTCASGLAGALATALVASTAAAQPAAPQSATADSLPIGARRWALEGRVGFGTAGADALRLVGARTALTFGLSGGYRTEDDDGTVNSFAPVGEQGSLSATLGVRRWGRPRGGLAPFGAVGVLATVQRLATPGTTQRESGVGPFLEGGVSYFALPRLALNASSTLSALRVTGSRRADAIGFPGGPEQPATMARTRGWQVSGGGVGLSATLFF